MLEALSRGGSVAIFLRVALVVRCSEHYIHFSPVPGKFFASLETESVILFRDARHF